MQKGFGRGPWWSAWGEVLNENGVQDPVSPREMSESGAPWRNLCGASERVLSLPQASDSCETRRCTLALVCLRRVGPSESPAMSDTCFWVCLGLPSVRGCEIPSSTLLRTDFEGLVF